MNKKYDVTVKFQGRVLGAMGIFERFVETISVSQSPSWDELYQMGVNYRPTNDVQFSDIHKELQGEYCHMFDFKVQKISLHIPTYDEFVQTNDGYELVEGWMRKLIRSSVRTDLHEFAMYSLDSGDYDAPLTWDDVTGTHEGNEDIHHVFEVEQSLCNQLEELGEVVVNNGWYLWFSYGTIDNYALKRIAFNNYILSYVESNGQIE